MNNPQILNLSRRVGPTACASWIALSLTSTCVRLTTVALLMVAPKLAAATHYVFSQSRNSTPPYTNWATAATNIQQAMSAAVAGDVVLATNDYYRGPVSVPGQVALRSVNGPQFTVIYGWSIYRCVALVGGGASVTGFTLTEGVPLDSGGGVYCAYRNCFLTNCMLVGNRVASAYGSGGGVSGGTLYNCTLTRNSAPWDGGACASTLYNCTLTGNSSGDCGGAGACTLYNCIVYSNSAPYSPNYSVDSTLNYCCTTPLPNNGVGNISSDPLFLNYANGNLRLQASSPCINAGNNNLVMSDTDLDGNPRIVSGTVDIGAYEFQSLSLLNFGVASNQAGFNITGQSNQVVIVESSSDLTNWSPLATNTLNGHPFPFSDPAPPTQPRRFYRAHAR